MANRLRLPTNDNTPEALAQLRHANLIYRGLPWPRPFDKTIHRLHLGDARDLSWLPAQSVHLVVTSPPYWTLKTYAVHEKCLPEDIFTLARSKGFVERVAAGKRVINAQNIRQGIASRRGDGTFGELIPGVQPVRDAGFKVARGPVATIEIGTEVKVLAKAMIKQIDRVMGDLIKQVQQAGAAFSARKRAPDLRGNRRYQSRRSVLLLRGRSGVGNGRQEAQASD